MTELFFDMSIDDIKVNPQTLAGYLPLTLTTSRGEIRCRYYHKTGITQAVLFVSGDQRFKSPGGNLYPKLCRKLQSQHISALHVSLRHPTNLVESVLDILSSITFLERFGIEEIGLVGYSLGGAAVIQAAAAAPESINTVVTLATQADGAEVATLLENISLLLIHGVNDEIQPSYSSTYIHDIAPGEKQLLLYQNATHGLQEVARPVENEIYTWLVEHLR